MKVDPSPVLYLTHYGALGGGELSLLQLIKNLDCSRYIPIVACPLDGALRQAVRAANVSCRPMQFGRATRQRGVIPTFSFLTLRQLLRLCRRDRISLIHAYSYETAKFAAIAGRLQRIPVVMTLHTFGFPQELTPRLLERLLSRTIAVSEAVRQDCLSRGASPHRTVTIYNGTDLSRFDPSLDPAPMRQELALVDVPVIGMVARLDPGKGHRDLLMAARHILARVPNAHFLFVGDDTTFERFWSGSSGYRTQLEALCQQLGIAERVVFTGFRQDIPALLAIMDVVVVPSPSESFGLAAAEAMAMARPLVVSRVGALPEITGNGRYACVVPHADIGALADSICSLLLDRETAAAMATAARKHVERTLSLDLMATRTMALYDELTGRASTHTVVRPA